MPGSTPRTFVWEMISPDLAGLHSEEGTAESTQSASIDMR